MKRFLLALLIVASVASTAAAGGGVVAIRRTPLRPFVGPVPVRAHVHAAQFVAPIHYHAPAFRSSFRYGYSAPFIAPIYSQPYYAPQPIVIQAPQPIVYAAPQPVVYAQPSLSYTQGYSYSSGQTQAIRQESVYRLPDGRLVLPSGQVIE